MPTYEYKCKSCGHKFEKFHSMTAAPIKKCPACGKNTVERLIGAGAGLIFKGSGFYITDYRDSNYTDRAKADTGEGPKESKDSGAKTEAAPAATADAKGEKKSETKTEAKVEAKPAPAPESKPTAKPEAKSSSAKSRSKRGS